MAKIREINSFQCEFCGETLESWNTAWVPTYRLIPGPAGRLQWTSTRLNAPTTQMLAFCSRSRKSQRS